MLVKKRVIPWLFLPVLTNIFILYCLNASNFGGSNLQKQNEECAACHVKTVNQSLSNSFQHEPFFNRECDKCHIPVDANGFQADQGNDREHGFGGKTGKGVVIKSGVDTLDHMASLDNLLPGNTYKFKLILRNNHPGKKSMQIATSWQDLPISMNPGACDELNPPTTADSRLSPETKLGVSQFGANPTGSLSICRVGNGGIVMSWHTDEAYESWVEIDGVLGTEKSNTTQKEKNHPQLRDPEATTIDACYACHTPQKLGTTHSIRVYSGSDAKIPDDLPTIKGGMMTCVTCHHPHGGDVKYFVRKKITTKLCVSCHYTFEGKSKHTVFGN